MRCTSYTANAIQLEYSPKDKKIFDIMKLEYDNLNTMIQNLEGLNTMLMNRMRRRTI